MGLSDFQILSKLGEGSYSSVWKVKRISDGQEYALKKVKLLSLTDKEKQNSINEVRILASIQEPTIIGYKEAFLEENNTILCIIMEYAAGGDLYNKILEHQKNKTFFKEQEIWNYAVQMILGLKTLHGMKILHRDLKCANIFISKDGSEAKLGDLNVSKVLKTNLVYTQTGTPYYASPEIWRDQPYDMKSDIWSLGCVIYEAAALKPPFRAKNMDGLYRKVQKGVFDRIPSQYSNELQNLIALCLKVSSVMRPTCDQLLKHSSVQRNCAEYLNNREEATSFQNTLLSTIRIPKNMRTLGSALPKPNYLRERVKTDSDVVVKRLPHIPGGGESSSYLTKGYLASKITTMATEEDRHSLRHDSSIESRLSNIVRLETKAVRMPERENIPKSGSELHHGGRRLKTDEHSAPPKELSVLSENVKYLKPNGYRYLAGRRMASNNKDSQASDMKRMDSLDEYENQYRRYSNITQDHNKTNKSTLPAVNTEKSRENLLPTDLVGLTMLENGKLVATRDITPHKILLKQNDVVNSYRSRCQAIDDKYYAKQMLDKALDDEIIPNNKVRVMIGRNMVAPPRSYNKSALDGPIQRIGEGSYFENSRDHVDSSIHQSYVSEVKNAYGPAVTEEKEKPRLHKRNERGYSHSHSQKYMVENLIYKENAEAYLRNRRQAKQKNF